ncbi:hypothetical protein ACFY9A_28885 [Streptomyces rubradiris]|uniref:hypothetical protein n=1 Tax=Streptomyces rubradiris TaxID=285531 RepID=UPI0036E35801
MTPADELTVALATAAERLRTARFTGAMTMTATGAALLRAREPLADWLGCLATLGPTERGGDTCGWCGNNHPEIVARAINAQL